MYELQNVNYCINYRYILIPLYHISTHHILRVILQQLNSSGIVLKNFGPGEVFDSPSQNFYYSSGK